MVQMVATNTILLSVVDEDQRGRVMGFSGMAFQGTIQFGGLLAG